MNTMYALLLICLTCALCLFSYYINEWRDFHSRKLPKGPTSLPFIGNIFQLDPNALHLCLTKMSHKFGKVFSIKMGRERVVILNSASIIKEAYNGPDVTIRPKVFSLDFFLERGFMTCREKTEFSLHTKLMRKTFRVITKTSFCEKLHQEVESLFEILDSYNQMPFDPRDDFNLASLNILHNIAFGKRYKKSDSELKEILEYTEEIGKAITPVHPVNIFPWLQKFPNPWLTSMEVAKQRRDKVLLRFYKEHLKSFRDDKIRDLVDGLIKIAKDAEREGDKETLKILTPYHIIINIWTIFFAGSDTILNAMLWIFLYLSVFPRVQEKIQQEMDKVIGRERLPELEDEPDLPYLCATIYETIRYSSLSLLGVPHAAMRNTVIEGFNIPEGTQVMANFYAINHSQTNWTDPQNFRPERFLTDNGTLHNLSNFPYFMPFSTGRRACLGKDIGKSEILLLTGSLLQRYTVHQQPNTTPNLDPDVHFDLVPKPYNIIFARRNCSTSKSQSS